MDAALDVPMADHELPDELPEEFIGGKRLEVHYNFGREGGAALYTWVDKTGRPWPIQEQYDTRKPKPATKTKPAFEPPKTGVVILDRTQPGGFYGEVCSNYGELREVWKEWRASKKQPTAQTKSVSAPLQEWPFPKQ